MSEERIPKSIYHLAQRISALHAEAQRLGIFIGDRELISCPHCGLMEDVDTNGFLLTCRPDSLGVDTGLRFEEVDSEGLRFRCPSCGTLLALEENDQ